MQEGKNLTSVQHYMPYAGQKLVDVELWDFPKTDQLDADSEWFWVLWVTITLKSSGDVEADDQAGYTWYTYTRPQTILVGQRTVLPGWATGMEYTGTCNPSCWDETVNMRRKGGEGSDIDGDCKRWAGTFWDGEFGDEAHEPTPHTNWLEEGASDNSTSSWLDEDPTSATTWPVGTWHDNEEPYVATSVGKVYDLDPAGYSNTTAGICRIRANFLEWAEYNAKVASSEIETFCAASVEWNSCTETWDKDTQFDGRGDNSFGTSQLDSTDWDIQD